MLNKNTLTTKFARCLWILPFLPISFQALGTPIVNTFYDNSKIYLSGSDLIQGHTGAVTGTALGGWEGMSTNASVLSDGVIGASWPSGNYYNPQSDIVAIGNGTVLTYALGSNPLGYTVNSIDTYAEWRDSGRSAQEYTVSYSLVSSINDFVTLLNINPGNNSHYDTSVSITDSSGALISGIADIRFTFDNEQNGFVGYSELQVNGSATQAVPAPATIVLLAAGLLGYSASRRKINQAQFSSMTVIA